jgi:hypothetical protein
MFISGQARDGGGGSKERTPLMSRVVTQRWALALAVVSVVAVVAVFAPMGAFAVPGGVQVSDQNDCTVGPTNVNQLAAGQTGYVWLIFTQPTTVRGYTYQVTGTGGTVYDSGIVKIRFQQCRKVNVDDYVAKFRAPTVPGGYMLTVFDETGAKVSSDNFSIV